MNLEHLIQDSALVERAKTGDSQAVGKLYDQHYQPIFRFIWSRVSDQATAEELTGELFIRMVANLPQYQSSGAPFRAWLYRIARNLIADHYRKHGGWQLVDIAETVHISADEEEDPMRLIAKKMTIEQVRQALKQIDSAQREVVELRFLVGLSIKEAAETVDKTVAAVKTLQHRGLKALRDALRVSEAES